MCVIYISGEQQTMGAFVDLTFVERIQGDIKAGVRQLLMWLVFKHRGVH